MKTLKTIGWFILRYLANIAQWMSVTLNVFFFFGNWNETTSSHFGRNYPNSLFAKFVDKLAFMQKVDSHCRHAVLDYIDPKDDLLPKHPEKILLKMFVGIFILVVIIIILYRLGS